MSNLTLVQDRVADHMDKIHTYFKPGVCVTVIVRTPGFPERDFHNSMPRALAMSGARSAGIRVQADTACFDSRRLGAPYVSRTMNHLTAASCVSP